MRATGEVKILLFSKIFSFRFACSTSVNNSHSSVLTNNDSERIFKIKTGGKKDGKKPSHNLPKVIVLFSKLDTRTMIQDFET